MGAGDVATVADLHRRCFPHYQSTQLGAAYCRQMLRAYASRPDAWVSVADDGSGPAVGYLVAAPRATQREVQRALLAWAAVGSLWHPAPLVRGLGRIAPRLRRLARGGSAVEPGPSTVTEPSAARPGATIRVVLVGVGPEARGRGVVDALLETFADTARSRGHLTADLSVAADNERAHRAYTRNGWTSDVEGTHFRLALNPPDDH
jgi:ribosomal protein S18 acetylase RimI-like enzyme